MRSAEQHHRLITLNAYRSSVELRPAEAAEQAEADDAFRAIVKKLFERDFENSATDRVFMQKMVNEGPHQFEISVILRKPGANAAAPVWMAIADGLSASDALHSNPKVHRKVLEETLSGIFDFAWDTMQSHCYVK